MNLVSIRIITADVARLVEFYETLIGVDARWATSVLAEVVTESGTVAIAGLETVALFGEGSAIPEEGRSVIVEFRVDDVDAVYARLTGMNVVQPPTTMPWGNRSLLLRDPDGHLVNVFTPVSAAALARGSRQ